VKDAVYQRISESCIEVGAILSGNNNNDRMTLSLPCTKAQFMTSGQSSRWRNTLQRQGTLRHIRYIMQAADMKQTVKIFA
jgi:hypothetical protein